MLTVIAVFLIIVFGMPIFGLYLLLDKNQEANRKLGLAVLIVGILVWIAFDII